MKLISFEYGGKAGDIVAVEVDRIGVLSNTVVEVA
jgi:2-keto-4-pentenoate hydratase/2-oxohepta-3-ene-1,7-dioic acid hydratase in catechol pathway